jgi:hypothetical protein
MSAPTRRAPRSRLLPLIAVTGSTLVFTVLLILVRTQWSPLESVDHSLAAALNNPVADRPTVLRVLRSITRMGSERYPVGHVGHITNLSADQF